jgi:transcriptional/translational regulatory protein YebC/TACO1
MFRKALRRLRQLRCVAETYLEDARAAGHDAQLQYVKVEYKGIPTWHVHVIVDGRWVLDNRNRMVESL